MSGWRQQVSSHPGNDQSISTMMLITGHESVLVTDSVLVETVWVLSGKRYGLDRDFDVAARDIPGTMSP